MGDSDYMKETYFSIMNGNDEDGCVNCGKKYMHWEMLDEYLCTYCADNATKEEE